ncbi:MAG: adenylate/guanylate cyclase domain-containing protein [Rhodospirillaceae bacterium]|nr:adenylate/guanylate cyclase domain-containing protein [Rhodospirillaceae bacterium]
MTDHRRLIPLSIVLSVVLLPLMAGVVAIIIWQSYSRSVEAALSAGRQLVGNLQTEVALQQSALLAPLKVAIATLSTDPRLTADGAAAMERPLLALLDAYPHIAAMRIGFESGAALEAVSLREIYGGAVADIVALSGARYGVRQVRPAAARGDGNEARSWNLYDANRALIAARDDDPVGGDPRAMPWFAAADAAGGPVDTMPYVMSMTATAGVSTTQGFIAANGERGAIAADMGLRQYSLPLESLAISENQQVFLFTGSGRLLAHTDYDTVIRKTAEPAAVGAVVDLASVDDLTHPTARAIVAAHRAQGGSFSLRDLEAGGTAYLAAVTRLAVGDGPDGSGVYMAFALPQSTFTAAFIAIGRNAALISALVMLASVPLIVLVARRLARPLAGLAQATDRIAQLDLGAPVSAPTRIAEIATLGNSLDRMSGALSQMAKYVPKSLVQDLVRSGLSVDVGGERRPIALLFTDVKDFTPIADGLAPEALMAQMSEYFDVLVRVILAHGGTVDKFVGDAVFAFWNAPNRQDDYVALAARAALAVRDASNGLNGHWRASGKPVWYTRIGVHAGEAVVGNVGSSDRMDYTAIGDTVNMGSRIEGLNKAYGTQVLISEQAVRGLAGQFSVRPIDLVVPKGATTPLEVFELRGPAGEARDAALMTAWADVIAAYRSRDWGLAQRQLNDFQRRWPDDGPALMFATRVAGFASNPPPAVWDGVTKFSDK